MISHKITDHILSIRKLDNTYDTCRDFGSTHVILSYQQRPSEHSGHDRTSPSTHLNQTLAVLTWYSLQPVDTTLQETSPVYHLRRLSLGWIRYCFFRMVSDN